MQRCAQTRPPPSGCEICSVVGQVPPQIDIPGLHIDLFYEIEKAAEDATVETAKHDGAEPTADDELPGRA